MFTTLDPGARRLLVLLLLAFVVFGAAFTVIGAALPQIIRVFHWSYALTGVVLAASAVGYFLSTFLCGFLVERFPPKHVLVTGLLLGTVGMTLFARSPSPWLNFVLGLAIGLCQGAIEVVTNLEIVHMEKKGQSRLMNLVHAFFAIGAILGPVFVGSLAAKGLGRTIGVFTAAGFSALLLAVLFAISRFPRAVPGPRPRAAGESGRLLRQPLLLLFTLFLMVYVGAEIGVSTWTSEYFVSVLGTNASIGAFAVSIFWSGLLVGRLAISVAYHGSRQELLVIGLSLLSTTALVLTILMRSPVAVGIGIFVIGLGFSGSYPLVMAMVGNSFKNGVAVGTAATGGGFGSFTFPFLMAILAQTQGLRGGFWFYAGLSAALVALGAAVLRLLGRRARAAG